MMRITVLGSGSGGNSTLFQGPEGAVLVDAGLPLPDLLRRMTRAGARRKPDAVVITHAHGDHHRFAVDAALHFKVPVWVSDATRPVLSLRGAPSVRVYGSREPFAVASLAVRPLPLPHDAPQVALRVEAAGRSAVIATDLGEVPAGLADHVRGADVLMLESNHDLDMLWKGPYSYSLKRRVASARGHLSNAQAGAFLKKLDRAVGTVVLMHLSETNNLPGLAIEQAAEALADHPARLLAASQSTPLTVDLAPAKQLELF